MMDQKKRYSRFCGFILYFSGSIGYPDRIIDLSSFPLTFSTMSVRMVVLVFDGSNQSESGSDNIPLVESHSMITTIVTILNLNLLKVVGKNEKYSLNGGLTNGDESHGRIRKTSP